MQECSISETKEELLHVINRTSTHTFVLDGKLFSIQVGTTEEFTINQNINIEQEIEEYPELKASLQRYLDDPNLKKYTANELKENKGVEMC